MAVSREVRAAIGAVIIDITWIEFFAARLVVLAGNSDNEMPMLAPGSGLFELALQAAGKLRDSDVAERTRLWVNRAEELRRKRHEVVHSIVLHSHRDGWNAYHPRSGTEVVYSTREIVDLARQVSMHADEGNYMCLFDWPRALDLADSAQADDENLPANGG